jgi:hypothetical protein
MVFSLGHLVIFGGKPENCEIPDSLRENPYYFGRVGIKAMIFFNNSFNNKLYEYEVTFEQLFSEKKLFDFKVDFKYLFYTSCRSPKIRPPNLDPTL